MDIQQKHQDLERYRDNHSSQGAFLILDFMDETNLIVRFLQSLLLAEQRSCNKSD